METGTVISVTRNGSRLQVRSGSTISLVDLIGDEGEIAVGDTLRGNWTSLGGETIYRGSQAFDVSIENYS